eukprot:m51a1_g13224 hypothetical protein (248) ;mRNA; f:1228-2502
MLVATNVIILATRYDLSPRDEAVAAAAASSPSQSHHAERQPQNPQTIRSATGLARSASSCGPPLEAGGEQWLDFVVPLRNRAARLVDIAYNMGELWREGGDRRFRVLFADLGSTDANLTDLVARLSRKTCVPMWVDAAAGFSRAHVLRAGLNEVYRRWPDDMVFCLDVDMQLPEDFVASARRYVVRGESYWAPVAFGTYDNKPIEVAPGNGRWRLTRKGQLGFFAADAVKINLFSTGPTASRASSAA